MKILLIGEYSNVHNTLAHGLRELGHTVTVISNGDFWKNYPRDIDVSRRPGKLGGVLLLAKIYALLPRMRGYDIVQFTNPVFSLGYCLLVLSQFLSYVEVTVTQRHVL